MAILVVVGFHASIAYLAFLRDKPLPFDQPPFEWRAFPIIDSHRWFGFDLLCAWQDVYLMGLMFFLSAIFVWPSLQRKGAARFLVDRAWRLGLPFLVGLAIIAPIAVYPIYLTTADDASLAAYARRLMALPFWPDGPMWFLWELMVLTLIPIALRRFAPRAAAALGRWSAFAYGRPGIYLLWLTVSLAVAYAPMAIAFSPWRWSDHGPFAFQLSRPLFYAVFYTAGLGVGVNGLGNGLLAVGGALTERWPLWFGYALAALFAWMGLTALTMPAFEQAPVALQLAAAIALAAAAAASLFFVMAVSLRFLVRRSRILDVASDNAMPIYFLHYAPVVWLQYALLPADLPAPMKAAIVFAGTLMICAAAIVSYRFAERVIGRRGATLIRGAAPSGRRI